MRTIKNVIDTCWKEHIYLHGLLSSNVWRCHHLTSSQLVCCSKIFNVILLIIINDMKWNIYYEVCTCSQNTKYYFNAVLKVVHTRIIYNKYILNKCLCFSIYFLFTIVTFNPTYAEIYGYWHSILLHDYCKVFSLIS